jgi:hypothetical protein
LSAEDIGDCDGLILMTMKRRRINRKIAAIVFGELSGERIAAN